MALYLIGSRPAAFAVGALTSGLAAEGMLASELQNGHSSGPAGMSALRAGDRLHCVTFVNVASGGAILAATSLAEGISDRVLKVIRFGRVAGRRGGRSGTTLAGGGLSRFSGLEVFLT